MIFEQILHVSTKVKFFKYFPSYDAIVSNILRFFLYDQQIS